MHFLLVGATGRTGSLILSEALSRGHTVTALVRNPDSVPAQPGLTLAKGSPMSADDVEAAFTSSPNRKIDAVIAALNVKRESGSPWSKPVSPADLVERSVANLAAAMKKHGVRKLVNMTAFGVGDSAVNMPWWLRFVVEKSNMGSQYKDHDNSHKVVKEDKDVDWVFVRPFRLTSGPKAKVIEHGNLGKGAPGFASISIASVADFMVSAAETSTWDKQTPVITN